MRFFYPSCIRKTLTLFILYFRIKHPLALRLRLKFNVMKKIVMLNDELGTQMQIYLALSETYRVEIAENTESAMYMLRKMKPEILVMDYNLEKFQSNGKTSIDFVKKIKKKYLDLKVMMILGHEDKKHVREIQENGVDTIVYKPIKDKNLISDIKRIATATAAA